MRNELENIQLIEKYLLGELSNKETVEFEKELMINNELRKSVEKQQLIMKASERKGIKNNIIKGRQRYKRTRLLKSLGLGVLVIGILITVYSLFFNHTANKKLKIDLPEQVFTIQNEKDTVIETENGLIIVIPANAFINKEGRTITENIKFNVKEAFNAHDIITSGLTTLSNGELLATGGMFFLEAYYKGEKLELSKGKEVLLDIPNINPNPKMMLFDGEQVEDGTINWVNPRPFDKDLITYDITSLDFYPNGYPEIIGTEYISGDSDTISNSKEVVINGKNYSKKYTDSLYYSFSRVFNSNNTMYSEDLSDPITCEAPSGINPAKIKSIWNKKYNNTILATKEFEERLKLIHELKLDPLLDVYVNNIDKPLWYGDSIANQICEGQFQYYYEQRTEGVQLNDDLSTSLTHYYKEKQQEFTQQSELAYTQYTNKKKKLQMDFSRISDQKDQEEYNRKMKIYYEELEINLDEAYRQLGKERVRINPNQITSSNQITPYVGRLRIRTNTLGAKNVDYFVNQSTQNRETLNFKDRVSGKTALIEYEEVNLTVKNQEKFDKIFVYMIPNGLNSYNRMTSSNNVNFKGKLNELFKYRLFCLAYNKGQPYYYESALTKGIKSIALKKISESKLMKKLSRTSFSGKNNSAEVDIKSDIDFYKIEKEYDTKKKIFDASDELTVKVGKFLFPGLNKFCILLSKSYVSESIYNDTLLLGRE